MSTVQVHLEIPEELVRKLDPSGCDVSARVREMVVLDLVRRREISSGKGAELLGISKREFRVLMHKHDIPYFNLTPEELRADIEAAGRAVVRRQS